MMSVDVSCVGRLNGCVVCIEMAGGLEPKLLLIPTWRPRRMCNGRIILNDRFKNTKATINVLAKCRFSDNYADLNNCMQAFLLMTVPSYSLKGGTVINILGSLWGFGGQVIVGKYR